MRIITLVLCGAAAVALVLVGVGGSAHADVVNDGGGVFITLFAVEASESGVVFVVREPGALCGPPYHVERFGENPALLAVIRDPGGHPCRGKLRIFARVPFSYEDLGLEIGERFRVINSIEAIPFTLPREASVGLHRASEGERP